MIEDYVSLSGFKYQHDGGTMLISWGNNHDKWGATI